MNTTKPQLIPGYEDRQAFCFPERTSQARWATPLKYCHFLAEDTARRVAASKDAFPWPFFRGDCHSHTQHSDGAGTVAETAEMVKAAELDFQFVTDHWGVTQAPECREHGLWYGQEPVTQFHHMGVLGLEYAFEPQQDFLADLAAAAEQGATVFVPHPTGWWPTTVYNEEQKKILEELPSPFLMEICNGANNIVTAFDYTDDSAIEIWDHLLCLGRKVHAMGNTDAHAPHGIGIIWNAVFAAQCDQETILSELKKGHSFVSEAPLVHFALGQARMGDTASTRDRESELEISVVDSRGLNSVAVIADGEEIFYQHFRSESVWNGTLRVPASAKQYVRVEARSRDGKRAYSNPIYLS
jgi:hypothetical protein